MTTDEVGPARPALRPSNDALMVITPLKPWGPPWLRLQFKLTRLFPALKGLEPFKSVYFSRWSILTSIPYNGRPQVRERPEPPYLLWEVAFSAEGDPYIESFARGIPANIERIWGSSYGFPGTDSVDELFRYIMDLSWPVGHAYWAYPDGTVRTVLSGLEVAKEHEFLVQAARSSTAEDFARIYRGFLRRRGRDL